jgi:hypothetical protein
MADTLTKVLGTEIIFNDVPADTYRAFGFPGAVDMGNMFQFKRDFDEVYCGNRNLELSRKLNPELMTFEQWVKKNKNLIPLG